MKPHRTSAAFRASAPTVVDSFRAPFCTLFFAFGIHPRLAAAISPLGRPTWSALRSHLLFFPSGAASDAMNPSTWPGVLPSLVRSLSDVLLRRTCSGEARSCLQSCRHRRRRTSKAASTTHLHLHPDTRCRRGIHHSTPNESSTGNAMPLLSYRTFSVLFFAGKGSFDRTIGNP